METRSSSILLKKTRYLNDASILTLFSLEEGLISVFAKNKTHQRLANPFCIGEWVYRKGKKDLYFLVDITMTDSLDGLRSNFETITAAGSIANLILKSQYPGKASPLLYALVSAYLKKMASYSNTPAFVTSFYLKLLLHEGISTLTSTCAHCEQPAFLLEEGASVCHAHATTSSISFSETEWKILQTLAFAKQFSLLNECLIPDELFRKIESLTLSLYQS